jgi:hypothetical protein
MQQRPSYWLYADPDRNVQFRRKWCEPPDSQERTRCPARGTALKTKSFEHNNNSADAIRAQLWADAEALFARAGAA